MAQLGFRTVARWLARRMSRRQRGDSRTGKRRNVDLSNILRPSRRRSDEPLHARAAGPGLERALDNKIIELAEDALLNRKPVEIHLPIRNVNRTVGTMLSAEVSRRFAARVFLRTRYRFT